LWFSRWVSFAVMSALFATSAIKLVYASICLRDVDDGRKGTR
jgi:hypothetical protein